jgi:hypothetical protein
MSNLDNDLGSHTSNNGMKISRTSGWITFAEKSTRENLTMRSTFGGYLMNMKLISKIGLAFLFCIVVFCGYSLAAPINDSVFKERLSKIGLSYSLPTGFVDDGLNASLEKKPGEKFDSVDAFVVHQIRSIDKKMAAYIDIRVLGGIDLKDPKLAAGYPLVFEANAAEYCAMVSGDSCNVLTKFPTEAVQADYNADFGIVFMAKKPNPKRIGGHKKASLIAISKPSKGLFYITIAYDSDEDFNNNFETIMYSLKFK